MLYIIRRAPLGAKVLIKQLHNRVIYFVFLYLLPVYEHRTSIYIYICIIDRGKIILGYSTLSFTPKRSSGILLLSKIFKI